ncbi:MAG: tandem-95 repeat protein [Gemmatimonadetes bacterium]|nr:MAG: tandem-95 repeat protein [Gemmatimonadota bacterium]
MQHVISVCLLFSFLLIGAMGGVLTSAYADPPNWNYNPADFQYTANVTGTLHINTEMAVGDSHVVAAVVNGDIRGIAAGQAFGDVWLYFLTISSNQTEGEEIHFQAYVADYDQVVDIDETLTFVPNAIYGNPLQPFVWNGYADFDFPPEVTGIPDQTIEQGSTFVSFDLDDYLITRDSDPVQWSYSGNQELQVVIDNDNRVSITPPNADWLGSETIYFTATDVSANQKSDSDSATFTIRLPDLPPQILPIPDQTIGQQDIFDPVDLDDYLIEENGDSVQWTVTMEIPTAGQAPPTWSVNPVDYQFSMNITARVSAFARYPTGDTHLLGAFINGEVRGAATAVEMGEDWLYFLTVYTNTINDTVHFSFYDADAQDSLPAFQSIPFVPSAVYGSPLDPFQIDAGYLRIDIDDENLLTFDLLDPEWTGIHTLNFRVQDVGTANEFYATDQAVYTVYPDHTPRIMPIPNQTIETTEQFTLFDLDDYLIEDDGDEVVWTVSGQNELSVEIGPITHRVTVTPPTTTWTGSETVTFRVTDQTPNQFFDTREVTFTVVDRDDPPDVIPIPDRATGIAGSFDPIDLNFYLVEVDGDSIEWSYEFVITPQGETAPTWSVNPNNYQFSMNMTALVYARGRQTMGDSHMLGAFVGDEVRGVSQAIQMGDIWLYFMTIYANESGETVEFQFFDALAEETFPVFQTLEFVPSAVHGNPLDPFILDAGYLRVSITPDDFAVIDIQNPDWTGNQTVKFKATDVGSVRGYSDSTFTTFTVYADHAPVLAGIPDQTVEQGQDFALFDLDDYLTELDGDELVNVINGNVNLLVDISAQNLVYVHPIDPNWYGTEHIRFTVMDVTPLAFTGTDTVSFTILPYDNPPQLNGIPKQAIEPGGQFTPIDMRHYLTELDGDSIAWSVQFEIAPQGDPAPGWTVFPTDFQYTMNITAAVSSQGDYTTGGDHILAAFVGESIRGVTQPIEMNGKWYYFLTVYANTSGETVRFEFYDADVEAVLPVAETVTFEPNRILGNPTYPQTLRAGYLSIYIDDQQMGQVEILDPTWFGTQGVIFRAQDVGSLHEYADTTYTSFKIDLKPVINNIPDQRISFNLGERFTEIDLNRYTNSPDGDPVTWTATSGQHLTATINGQMATISILDTTWTGTESLIFTATEITMLQLSDTDTVDFTIYVGHPPQFTTHPDSTVLVGNPYTYNIAATDADLNDPVTLMAPTKPDWLTFTPGTDQTATLTGTPTLSDIGAHEVVLTATDDPGNVTEQRFTIVVADVNRLPYFTSTPDTTTPEGNAYRYEISVADTNPGDVLTVTAPAKPDWLTLTPAGTNTAILTGIPGNDHVGPNEITLQVTDIFGAMRQQSFRLWVINVNNPPTARDDTVSTPEETPVTVNLAPLVTDVDVGDSLTWNLFDGDLRVINYQINNVAQTVTFTPVADSNGTYTMRLRVTDSGHETAFSTITIYVTPVNDAPQAATPANIRTNEDVPVVLDLAPYATDIDSDSLTWQFLSGDGQVSIRMTGNEATFTPSQDVTGTFNFQFQVADDSSATDTLHVILTIDPVNDPPVWVHPLPDTTFDEDTSITFDLKPYVQDVETSVDDLTWSTGMALLRAGNTPTEIVLQKATHATRSGLRPRLRGVTDLSKSIAPIVTKAPASPDRNEDIPGDLRESQLTIQIDDNGIATVTPNPDWTGSEGVVITVMDEDQASASDTMTVTVRNVNDVPQFAGLPDTILLTLAHPIDLTLGVNDPDVGDSHTFTRRVLSGFDSTLAEIRDGNILHFNPTVEGTGTVEIQVSDTAGSTDTDTLYVSVEPAPLTIQRRYEIIRERDQLVHICFEVCTDDPQFTVYDFTVSDPQADAYFYVRADSIVSITDLVEVQVANEFQGCTDLCFTVDLADSRLPEEGGITLLTDLQFHGANTGAFSSQFRVIILPVLPASIMALLGDVEDLTLQDLWPLADFDGDGQVDGYDLLTLIYAYGSQNGDPHWNERCDIGINGFLDLIGTDQLVSFADLVRVASYYGQTALGSTIEDPRDIPDGLREEIDPRLTLDAIADTTQVTVDIRVEGMDDLYAYELLLDYPADRLKFVGANEGDFFKAHRMPSLFAPVQNVAERGQLRLSGSKLGAVRGVSGSGVIATLLFEVTKPGTWALDPIEAVLLNSDLQPVIGIPLQGTSGKTPLPVHLPENYALYHAYPNPFNPQTTLPFALPVASAVQLRIYDISGRLITTLVDQKLEAGYHQVVWDGTNATGKPVASGVYFYTLQASPAFKETKQMLLLK